MNKKQIIYFTLFSIILFAFTLPLASSLFGLGGHNLKFMLTTVLYTLVSWQLLKYLKHGKAQKSAIMILMLPPVIITGFILGNGFFKGDVSLTIVSWLSSLAYFIGMGFGFLLFYTRKGLNWLILIFVIMVSTWVYFYGYNYYLHFINYKNFNGKTSGKTPEFNISDKLGNSYNNKDFVNKTVIFDFWFTRCGSCFRDMPRFEKLFQRYGRDGTAFFYSVNFPISTDTVGYADYIIKDYGFSFPVLYAKESVIRSLRISCYPTYIVFRNEKILFRGDIENLESYTVHHDLPFN
jgi:thiol-disulfide isomerase/thioredoxin